MPFSSEAFCFWLAQIQCVRRVIRVPVAALGGVQGSLMPMHSATASALLTSMLGLKPGSWGWLSEGKLV
jgi:hypothetical protein